MYMYMYLYLYMYMYMYMNFFILDVHLESSLEWVFNTPLILNLEHNIAISNRNLIFHKLVVGTTDICSV